MARLILGMRQLARSVPNRPATAVLRGTLSPAVVAQRLRERRSPAYIDALTQLDGASSGRGPVTLEVLVAALATEFAELTVEQGPQGLVGRCLLGPPYELHAGWLTDTHMVHYEIVRAMPPLLERARPLALDPAHAFVEVYRDALRAVAPGGRVTLLEL
jgi:hypothetical protein